MRDEKIMNALINVRIFDYENYIESGYVVFDERVQEVGKMSEFKNKGYKIIDGKGDDVYTKTVPCLDDGSNLKQ